MSRVQLALNVGDLDKAIEFYSTLFDTKPAKIKPGYANFAIANPPLKLVLIQGTGEAGTLNHLGVEVESTDEVRSAHERITGAGMGVAVEGETTCCYAVQDKFWIEGGETAWEVYTVLAPAEVMHPESRECCAAAVELADATTRPACC